MNNNLIPPAVDAPAPYPMDTAPKDGTIVRLLVRFTDGAFEDVAPGEATWTIGQNGADHHPEDDEWLFAGWNWEQDCFTQGEGEPIGWLPLHGAFIPDGQSRAASGVCDTFPPAAFEEWFAGIEAGDGTIPVPKSIADGDAWNEHIGRRQIALGAWVAATEAAATHQPIASGVSWHAPTEIPAVEDGDDVYAIIAVRRKHDSSKIYSFPAQYLNHKPLLSENPREASGNGWSQQVADADAEFELYVTGWFCEHSTPDGEYDVQYEAVLSEGDELIAWAEIPQYAALQSVWPVQRAKEVTEEEVMSLVAGPYTYHHKMDDAAEREGKAFDRCRSMTLENIGTFFANRRLSQ